MRGLLWGCVASVTIWFIFVVLGYTIHFPTLVTTAIGITVIRGIMEALS